MSTDFSHITFRIADRTAHIELNRPPLNILDVPVFDELQLALDRIEETPEVQFLTLRGAGPKAFCAGVEVGIHRPETAPAMLETFHGLLRRMLDLECISIAGVHGLALGGGCELAVFCDYVFATETARLGQPEINVGCFPPVAAALFPRLMGSKQALDFIAGGEPLRARQALEYGLVTRVVADDALDASIEALLEQLKKKSAAVLQVTRRAVLLEQREAFLKALESCEKLYVDDLLKLDDAAEGIEAFIAKRQPNWQHR